MIEVEKGHVYDLTTHDGQIQRLTFVKSLPKGDATNHDGVLNQEVLRALIRRLADLNDQVPSKKTLQMIKWLRKTLIEHEVRAFENTLRKCYSVTGLHVEQMPIKANGHFYDPRS